MNVAIANVGIRQIENGLFCINDLHRASGGEHRHRPNYWIQTQVFRDLANQMEIAGFPAFESKQGVGTFVAKELVYAYAMWISPSFHLQVIRTFDKSVAPQVPQIPQSLPEALRLAADLADEVEKQKLAMIEMQPKADALDLLSSADGSFCLTDAAKSLQVPPHKFCVFLQYEKWIYRRPGNGSFIAYQTKIQAGYLIHKITTIPLADGSERISEQVRVTPKGMAKLATMVIGARNAAHPS
ncbi:MAG TPA: DNA-binding protein [Nitrospiraceae bacterium]|nr:DNA-binding protein [Nitrospiraceae bacterium]